MQLTVYSCMHHITNGFFFGFGKVQRLHTKQYLKYKNINLILPHEAIQKEIKLYNNYNKLTEM